MWGGSGALRCSGRHARRTKEKMARESVDASQCFRPSPRLSPPTAVTTSAGQWISRVGNHVLREWCLDHLAMDIDVVDM